MKNKILKITSLFMSLIMLVTVNSGLTATAYAASKPSKTSVTSVGYKSGKTVAKVKKVSYKDGDSAVDYYELQYSENKNFKSAVNVVASPCSDGTSVTIDMPLATGVTYYFRVRTRRDVYKQKLKKVSWSSSKQKVWTYDSTSCSDWSSVKKAYVNWVADGNNDEGIGDALVQAKAVIATLGITDNMSDLEKLARVQNWINHNWYYSQEEPPVSAGIGMYNSIFTYGYGACNDYAYALTVFMYVLNIPCTIVGGSNHFWNIVKIDGYWHNYDCESFKDDSRSDGHFVNEQNALLNYNSESLELWNSCQPHGAERTTEMYSIINTL